MLFTPKATTFNSTQFDFSLIQSLNQIRHTNTLSNRSAKKYFLWPTNKSREEAGPTNYAQQTNQSLEMSLPVLERRRMPKSQLEVMSMDWERSQEWLSVALLPPSLRDPDTVDPLLLPDRRARGHFSRSTSWSISTISHIPVSSLVTWDCLMWARIIVGLSKKAIPSVLYCGLQPWMFIFVSLCHVYARQTVSVSLRDC